MKPYKRIRREYAQARAAYLETIRTGSRTGTLDLAELRELSRAVDRAAMQCRRHGQRESA